MTEIPDRLVIFGGNFGEALYWCKEWGINPRDRRVILVSSAERLFGLRDIHLVYVGNWAVNRSLEETYRLIERIQILRATGSVRAWLPPTSKGSPWPTT